MHLLIFKLRYDFKERDSIGWLGVKQKECFLKANQNVSDLLPVSLTLRQLYML